MLTNKPTNKQASGDCWKHTSSFRYATLVEKCNKMACHQ